MNPAELVEHSRREWKNGSLTTAVEGFTTILNHNLASVQEKLTVIHTMINDCYNPEQKEAIATVLEPIYIFLQDVTISYASTRDVLASTFRIRNAVFQQENLKVFKERMNVWASSTERYAETRGINGGMTFYYVYKAWQWVCDAIECARPEGKETLRAYLITWISDPPFNENLPRREKCKYQFFASEFLLQSHHISEQRIVSNFLLEIAESAEYSTFIRGDALDVLLRNPTPPEYNERIAAVHILLRDVREDTAENRRLQDEELGIRQDILYRPHEPYIRPQFGPAIKGTTFNDAQSVHATAVNEAIKESLINLSKDPEVRGNTVYKVAENIKTMITELNVDNEQSIRAIAALKRYIEDPAVFTDQRIKLGAVLVFVWNRILKHDDYSELCHRLVEELAEAFNTCATGHLSRIVSVLAGYYPDIKQFVSFETQLDNNIKARISAAVRKAPEEIQGDLFIALADTKCDEYVTFVNFLTDIREPVYKELYDDFVPKYVSKETFDMVFIRAWPQ